MNLFKVFTFWERSVLENLCLVLIVRLHNFSFLPLLAQKISWADQQFPHEIRIIKPFTPDLLAVDGCWTYMKVLLFADGGGGPVLEGQGAKYGRHSKTERAILGKTEISWKLCCIYVSFFSVWHIMQLISLQSHCLESNMKGNPVKSRQYKFDITYSIQLCAL